METFPKPFNVDPKQSRRGYRQQDITAKRTRALLQYTRFFGLMYSTSSVSVYSWTGR